MSSISISNLEGRKLIVTVFSNDTVVEAARIQSHELSSGQAEKIYTDRVTRIEIVRADEALK